MPRIPYLPADLAEPADIVAAMRARRGGRLLNLDRTLLHSPPLARGWNAFLGAVRRELALAPRLRELAICAVAVLNEDPYEYQQHAPELLAAGGGAAQLETLRDPEAAARNTTLFDAGERAVIRLSIEMTRQVQVSDGTFAEVRRALPGEREVVELVAVIATFNMVSRFLVALGVEPE
jgi:alkylhydroperoxidase family enzyme